MIRIALSSLTVVAMLFLLADGSANAQQSKPKPQPKTYSKTLTFTISTTQPSKPGKGLKANKTGPKGASKHKGEIEVESFSWGQSISKAHDKEKPATRAR